MYAASGEARNHPSGFGSTFANKPADSLLFDSVPEPDELPAWLTEADLDYYASNFEKTGFRGGLNRYRNMDRDWEELPQLAEATITQPALFIAGEHDGVIAMTNPEGMRPFVPDLRKLVILPGAGHWIQQERPVEVNAELIAFLNSL
jgi:pimeloyl-ACP methyl ester carboxylesterase